MLNKRNLACFLAILIFVNFMTARGTFAANDIANRPDPVVVEGANLPKIVNSDIGKIGVFVYRNGAWDAIPFQIDERFGKGKDDPEYVIPPEKDSDPKFDDNDELVMMAQDFGDQAPPEEIAAAKLGQKATAQISIKDVANNQSFYAYVMVFDSPPPPSDKKYVHWDSGKRQLLSNGKYTVGYPARDAFFFDGLSVPTENGGDGVNFLDTFKMRANARIISQLFVYNADNSDWQNTEIGVINGPVRVIRRVQTRFNSTLFRVHRDKLDVIYYPDFFVMEIPIKMGTKISVYYQADVRFSLDLADDAAPMSFFNERNPQSPEVVTDGVMTEAEKKLDYRPVKWSCLTGKPGTVLFRLDQTPKAVIQQDLFYLDDSKKPDPPERFPGHRGDAGFALNNIEKYSAKNRVYKLTFAFPPSGTQSAIDPMLAQWNAPLAAKVTDGAELARNPTPPLPPDIRKQPPRPSYLPPPIETRTRGYLPQLLIDPNLGYGSGFQIVERNTFDKGLSTDFLFLVSHRMYQFYRLEEIYKNLGPIDEVRLWAEYIIHPNRYFYGVGNGQTPDDLTVWKQERFWAWLLLQHKFTDWLSVGVRFETMHTSVAHGKLFSGDEPSIEERFGSDSQLTGPRFGDQVYGMRGGYTNGIGAQIAFDFRDDEVYPSRGTYNIFSVLYNSKYLGSDYEYAQYRADLRYYYGGKLINPELELPWKLLRRNFIGAQTKRVIAFRAVAQRSDAPTVEFAGRSVKDIPFYNLSYFGDAHTSRGHYWAQYCDNDLTFVMAEYRWHMYKLIDGTLFYDVGRVWDNMNDRAEWETTNWDDLHSSYGFGMRFNMVPKMMMRIDFGLSKENPGGLLYVWAWHTF